MMREIPAPKLKAILMFAQIFALVAPLMDRMSRGDSYFTDQANPAYPGP